MGGHTATYHRADDGFARILIFMSTLCNQWGGYNEEQISSISGENFNYTDFFPQSWLVFSVF